jgi:dihydroxyacid dehydratase/phosphogluconate dehydratase
VQDKDLIKVDLEAGTIDLIGTRGKRRSEVEMQSIIAKRLSLLAPWAPPPRQGLLDLYTRFASPANEGARLKLD